MTTILKLNLISSLFLASMMIMFGCKKDDPQPQTQQITGDTKQYALNSVSNPTVSGTVTLAKRNDNATVVTLQLSGTSAGASHPAHIHANTAAEGGAIVLDLTNVDGATGRSETIVTKRKDGSDITYEQLLTIEGFINVHESAANLATIIAQGDIGKNELTSTSKTYTLNSVSNNAVNGTAKFTKRASGETLVSIALTGTTSGVNSPAHIHLNTSAQGGAIAIDLTPVMGANGKSETSVSKLDNGTAITYDELLSFNGHLNVHQDANNLAILIAQGNIGANDGVAGIVNYNVTNTGSTAYVFNGGGFLNSSNPNLTLQRGKTYTFTMNVSGHPFYINTVQGTGSGNAYNIGVTNNGAQTGTLTFSVANDAPNTLFYNCEFHSLQTGVITITN